MPKKRAHAYELPDGTPSYWDKDNPEPAKASLKRTGQMIGEALRSYQGKLVSGKVFRARAGITRHEFTKLIRRRDLVPICRNAANYSLFAEEDIERIRQEQNSSLGIVSKRRGMIDEQCEYTAEEAHEVLSRFNKGMTMQQVVLDTKTHPVIVQSIWRDWVRMEQGLWLSKEDLDAINKLPLEGSFPITTGTELYEVLLLASKDETCGQCGERPRSGTCLSCARKAIYKAKRSERMRKEGVPVEAEDPTYSEPEET